MQRKGRIINRMLLVLISGIAAFSCEQDPFVTNVNCDECYYNEPDSANIIVYLTINEENPYVPLVIYKGEVEEDRVEWVDTAVGDEYRLYSPVNEYYSIEAKYKSGNRTIIAVDGDKMKTSLVADVCDYDCYIIKGGYLDVRLKEY